MEERYREKSTGPSWSPCAYNFPWGFYGGFIIQAWLIKISAISAWTPSSAPLLSIEVCVGGEDGKFQPSNHMVVSTGNQPPSLGGSQ